MNEEYQEYCYPYCCGNEFGSHMNKDGTYTRQCRTCPHSWHESEDYKNFIRVTYLRARHFE